MMRAASGASTALSRLVGGAIDDLTLAGYRETVDPDSPEIVLLSPRNTANPYFIDMGWVNAADSSLLTVSDTEWTADRDARSAPTSR